MGILAESRSVCRICGLSTDYPLDLLGQVDLCRDLSFYLPLEIKADDAVGPFPKIICSVCNKEFLALKTFIIKLNEGQQLLAEQLRQLDNVVIKVPNFLADKKTLFKEKFPSVLRAPAPTRIKPLLPKEPPSSAAVLPLPNKRTRKLPKRLAESLQGNELEKIFVKGEPSTSSSILSAEEVEQDQSSMLVAFPSDLAVEEEPPPTAVVEMLDTVEPKTTVILNKGNRGRQRNKCDICMRVFKLAGRLAHHRSTVHRGSYFECTSENCGRQYKTRESISLHQKVAGHNGMELVEPGKHACEKCQKSFATKSSLDIHNIEEHFIVGGSLKCATCLETFPSFPELKDHSRNVHGLESLKELACDVCSKTFSTPSELYRHMEIDHRQMNVFICKICSRPFKNKNLLTRHLSVVHTDSRPFACQQCDLKFKSSTNLKAHQTMHTGEKKFSCEVCGKLFAYKTSLIQHIKLHEGDKPFECPHCSKRFTQKGNLEEHIRTHTGEKPYACSMCDRRFTTSSQHKTHEKRHKGEKPWQCEHCPKAFLHKESYKAHIRRHKGEKPFSCEFCSKAFTEIWALKKHKRLHTGEKPYKCKDCGKSFADSSNLTKHTRAHLRAGDEVTAKDGTVWNIINQATEEHVTSDSNDVQQIIYIAYEDGESREPAVATAEAAANAVTSKETSIHIVSQTTSSSSAAAVNVEGANSGTQELDLSQFSASEEEATTRLQPTATTFHVISQEGLRLDEDKMEANVQYVDLSVKEGQQIRLRVPLDADPIMYAKEYLQTLADSGEILPSLEEVEAATGNTQHQ